MTDSRFVIGTGYDALSRELAWRNPEMIAFFCDIAFKEGTLFVIFDCLMH